MEQLNAQRARIIEKLKGQFFMHHIGFEITVIEEGYVEGEMDLVAFTKQQMGYVHGGVTATVADIVAGFAAYTKSPLDNNVVTSNLQIMYYYPGQGERLRAIGRVVKAGSRLHYCESEIYVLQTGKSTLIAKATATMVVV
ncbi:MAG: PaaI family thioesterase [Sphingobacteriaceae bacterium]|nr:PaaI family thioesterase [Sphingobacteriaceae bacterium]